MLLWFYCYKHVFVVNGQTYSIYITFGDFLLNLRRLYVHCIQRGRLTTYCKLYFPEGLGGDWTHQNFEKSHEFLGVIWMLEKCILSLPAPHPHTTNEIGKFSECTAYEFQRSRTIRGIVNKCCKDQCPVPNVGLFNHITYRKIWSVVAVP
jgi:hypothetical protein